MDEILRDRLSEVTDRFTELLMRVSRLEKDNDQIKQALLVILKELKQRKGR